MTDPLSPRNPAVNALRREHDELRSRLFKNQEERVELTDAAKSVRAAIAALDPFDDGEELEEAQRPLEGLEPAPEEAHQSPISTALDALFTGVSVSLNLPTDPTVNRRPHVTFKRGAEVLETHFPELPEDAPMIAAVKMLKDLGYRLEGQVWFPPEKVEPAPVEVAAHAQSIVAHRAETAVRTLEADGYTYLGDDQWVRPEREKPVFDGEQQELLDALERAMEQSRRTGEKVGLQYLKASRLANYIRQGARQVSSAVEVLKSALKADADLAWAWHCNIAMPIKDAIPTATHRLANMAAARVMRHLFDVDTESSPRMPAPDTDPAAPPPAPEVLKIGIGDSAAVPVEEEFPIGRRYCLMPHVAGIAKVIRFEDFGDLVVARPAGADANVVTEARLSQVQFLSPALAKAHEDALKSRILLAGTNPEPQSAPMPDGHIEPTVGRKVWLRIPRDPLDRRNGLARNLSVLDDQPVDATIAWVHPVSNSPYTYLTVFVVDHDATTHRLVLPLRQCYQPEPDAREWIEWMPWQIGQAKKGGAA